MQTVPATALKTLWFCPPWAPSCTLKHSTIAACALGRHPVFKPSWLACGQVITGCSQPETLSTWMAWGHGGVDVPSWGHAGRQTWGPGEKQRSMHMPTQRSLHRTACTAQHSSLHTTDLCSAVCTQRFNGVGHFFLQCPGASWCKGFGLSPQAPPQPRALRLMGQR